MSAWIVDHNHIDFLVFAAKTWKSLNSWDGQRWRELTPREAGQILWSENVRSVVGRYPDCPKDALPGPTAESLYMFEPTKGVWPDLDPVQVLKAARCLNYQCCDHEEWEGSEACRFLDNLITCAIGALPGYDAAEWGAPKPSRGMVSLSNL